MSELRRRIFEYVITRALRAVLLHLLQKHESLFAGPEVDERAINLFTEEALRRLNKCGDRNLRPETFPGELVALWRFYHHGLNTAGFQDAQTKLWRFLNSRKGDVEMLKLTQRITAEQRYTLMRSTPLSLDVFCLSLESLIVVFRDILGEKLNCIHDKDLLDNIYKIIEIRRRFLHIGHSTNKETMREIFEISSDLRVKFFKHAFERCTPNTKDALFWKSHLTSSLHFTCVLEEDESIRSNERRGIPMHTKRKTSFAHNVLPDSPRMCRSHGSHCPPCQCNIEKSRVRNCVCKLHKSRKRRQHSAEGPGRNLIHDHSDILKSLKMSKEQRPSDNTGFVEDSIVKSVSKEVSSTQNTPKHSFTKASDLNSPVQTEFDKICNNAEEVQPFQWEWEGATDASNIFVREAKGSIAKVEIFGNKKCISRGTAVCIGEWFIVSAWHVFSSLVKGTFQSARFTFDFNNDRTIALENRNEYYIVYESEFEDVVIVKILALDQYSKKPLPLALMGKDVVREPEAIDGHHPEGWPLCMHGAGYPSGKLTINERMKILHRDEMAHMAAELMSWYKMTLKESIEENRNKFGAFRPIADMLESKLKACGMGCQEDVFMKFLFPSDDDVYFVADLQNGASGCPCLVFDQYNDPVIQVVLLGACPKEIFAKAGAKKDFPSRFIVRRGLSASSLYQRLTSKKKLTQSLAGYEIHENSYSCTWMLH